MQDIATLKLRLDNSAFNQKMKASTSLSLASMAKITAGVYALKKVFDAGLGFTKAAADAAEIQSKFQFVFRDIADSANTMARSLSDSFNLASSSSKKLLGDTGDLLTGFGYSQKAALDLSMRINQLAGDLSSLQNISFEEASQSLTSGILGNVRAMRHLGIVVRLNSKEFKELVKNGMKVYHMTQQQARVNATLQMAYEQSKNAIGDYARTADSVANRIRALNQQWIDLKVAIGNGVNEVLIQTGALTSLKNILNELVQFTKDNKDSLANMFKIGTSGILAYGAAATIVSAKNSSIQRIIEKAGLGMSSLNSLYTAGAVSQEAYLTRLKRYNQGLVKATNKMKSLSQLVIAIPLGVMLGQFVDTLSFGRNETFGDTIQKGIQNIIGLLGIEWTTTKQLNDINKKYDRIKRQARISAAKAAMKAAENARKAEEATRKQLEMTKKTSEAWKSMAEIQRKWDFDHMSNTQKLINLQKDKIKWEQLYNKELNAVKKEDYFKKFDEARRSIESIKKQSKVTSAVDITQRTTPQSATTSVADAVRKGSVDAVKLENTYLNGTSTIEQNTKDTVSNIDKSNNLLVRLNNTLDNIYDKDSSIIAVNPLTA